MVTEFNWFSLEIIWEFDSFVYTFALLSFTFFLFFHTSPEKIPEIPYIYIYICIKTIEKRSALSSKKRRKTLDIVERNKNKGIRSLERDGLVSRRHNTTRHRPVSPRYVIVS